jgi:Zn-dependent oligopeptidase
MKKVTYLASVLLFCSTIATAQKTDAEIRNVDTPTVSSHNTNDVLTKPFITKHGTAPFSQIKIEDFKPAFEEAIQIHNKEIQTITSNKAKPNFENTIAALDYSGETLSRISSIFYGLTSAETSTSLQSIAQEIAPIISDHGNDITLNEALFERIKSVYDQKDKLDLTTEQKMLLEKTYKRFSRNGALLTKNQKSTLRNIDTALASLALNFGKNVLADNQGFILHITDDSELSGLPETAIEAAKAAAKARSLAGWVFTLDAPSMGPFLTYADHRNLRQKLLSASATRGFNNNENDNRTNVLQIVKLRHQRAQLLGYKTHAHFVLEERMAQNPETVKTFLNTLLEKAKPAAEREFKALSDFAKELDGIEQLERWDQAYYTEKYKQKLYNFDAEALKPYFELNNVLNGAFSISERLFGLRFTEVFDIDTYHEEVRTFEVFDQNGDFIAVFYVDFHPRKGKRNGAWMSSFKKPYIKNGVNERPHVTNVCNFTRPTETKPSLLSFNEVTTLFHEFGHALHGMLGNTIYPGLSGTSVYWDFVELPSQIMENWCYEPEALALFAKHYQTGEVIPQEFVDKIRESASFMEGTRTLRQLSLGMLDMAYHSEDPSGIEDIEDFEIEKLKPTNLYPIIENSAVSTAFSHVFSGGYSSGYYSYKWAEVLDADAFEYFQEKGIFNPEVAKKFQDFILSKGGTEHPMELYKKFRGHEPKPEALLIRAGLMK